MAIKIESGTTSSNISVYDNTLYISPGGTANSTWVNQSGYMYISSGGTANSTTVDYGGRMYILSGGIHRGTLQIGTDSIVSAYSGAVIDFTIRDTNAADTYLINDLSRIQGEAAYTITLQENSVDGVYKLAQGAANFTGSVSIGNDSVVFGSITVNGSDFIYNNKCYTWRRLKQVEQGGDLVLKIRMLIA